jgi:hypothetical protein
VKSVSTHVSDPMFLRVPFQESKKRSFRHPLAHEADRRDAGGTQKRYDIWVTQTLPGDNFVAKGLPAGISIDTDTKRRTDDLRSGPVILVEPQDLHGHLNTHKYALVHVGQAGGREGAPNIEVYDVFDLGRRR